MKKTFGIGIVGCGYSAKKIHYPVLKDIQGQFKIKACFDIDQDKVGEVAEMYDAKVCSTLEAMLASPDVDLVLVCTKPPSTHTDIGLAALAAGKHVLLEKPMCGTHEEGIALINKAAETGKILSVYQNRRWDPDFVSMQWAVEQGYFGRIKLFETLVCGNLLNANWMFDWGVHLIDQAITICGGRPVEVNCGAAGDAETESGPWFASIRFDNGKIALTTMRTGAPGDYPRYSVIGDQAAAAWPIWRTGTIKPGELIADIPPLCRGAGKDILELGAQNIRFVPFYQNLYDTLNGNAELAVTPEQALMVVDVTLAAIKSSKEKRSIQL